MIDASIIVVAHNDEADLIHSVSSALAQRGVRVETLVVDNDSSDGSCEAVRRVGREEVRLVKSPENVGFAAAMNLGIGLSSGRYVLALNPDCRLAPDFAAILAGRLDRRPDVGSASEGFFAPREPASIKPDGSTRRASTGRRPGGTSTGARGRRRPAGIWWKRRFSAPAARPVSTGARRWSPRES